MIWALVAAIAAAGGALGAMFRARRRGSQPRRVAVDPFVLSEPWRRHISAAQSSQRAYQSLVSSTEKGPLRDRLTTIGERIDDAVQQAWQIARHGDELDDRISTIGSAALRVQLERISDPAMRASLESQVQSADRIKATRDATDARLRLLTTRMGELVSQAAEVSVGNDPTAGLGTAVEDVVGQLDALRQAVNELNVAAPVIDFDQQTPAVAEQPGTTGDTGEQRQMPST